MSKLSFFISLCFLLFGNLGIKPVKPLSVFSFGAKGDGVTDDTDAFFIAISKASILLIPKATYLIKRKLNFKNINNKSILANEATIMMDGDDTGLIAFENCENINIRGGNWIHKSIPKSQGKVGNEHTFTFANSKNISLSRVHINGSAQMGICLMGVVKCSIDHCDIRNCFRDGIYAHYSEGLSYTYNYLENIKDDAMSMHDYGIKDQKTRLKYYGYKQSGDGIVKGNRVNHCYQGFSSIGCKGLYIAGNDFENTINAGIAIFNSETLYKNGDARVANVVVKQNTLINNGRSDLIMGNLYKNNGQLSSGRCALFVAVNDTDNLINHPQTRLKNIRIAQNTIINSRVNGSYIAQVDGLIFENNIFKNCDVDRSKFTGRIVEIRNCTNALITKNTVIDTRKYPLHDAGFEVTNVTGKMNAWIVKGYKDTLGKYIINCSFR